MPITDKFHRLALDAISIRRDERQRREIVVDDLLPSIRENGVLQPIVVEPSADGKIWLIAGERRLEASRQLGLPDIICRYSKELTPLELKIIEFDENNKRKDLTWTEQMDAIWEIHEELLRSNADQTTGATGEKIGLSQSHISNMLVLRKACEEQPELREMSDWKEASNRIRRRNQRLAGDALAELLADASELIQPTPVVEPIVSSTPGAINVLPTPAPPPRPRWPESILCQSFLDWAPSYTGPKFTVIHCDFPYGVGLFSGQYGQRSAGEEEQYSDEKDVYFTLLDCLLDNLDRFMSLSGHLYFWLSMKHYDATRERFRERAPSLQFTSHPLIWGKSDNAGIIGDARRDPRHTYEVCLFARRQERMLVGSKADFYHAPTDRTLHPSAKPEPVLRHFLSMTVDDTTSLFDPTCGSGSALRAAESLGAKHVLGLEIDPETCEVAKTALLTSRRLRMASSVVA